MAISAQQVIPMLENDKPSIMRKSTTRINHPARRRRPYRLPRFPGDHDAFTTRQGGVIAKDHLPLDRPLPVLSAAIGLAVTHWIMICLSGLFDQPCHRQGKANPAAQKYYCAQPEGTLA